MIHGMALERATASLINFIFTLILNFKWVDQ